jgi:peptidoglycan/xylan/chitin deacetylase (PgdA/CDA1 family)
VAPWAAGLVPGIITSGPQRDREGAPSAYLTFDDGPDPAGTPLLLGALERFAARATFFLLAGKAARDAGYVRSITGAGHAVGSHGWSHLDAWRDRRALADLRRGTAWLEDALGAPVRDVRPPFGRVTPASYRWARSENRRIVLWDSMPGDFASVPTRDLARRLLRRLRPGSIIVLHDGASARRAADVLDAALPELVGAGWRFPALPS